MTERRQPPAPDAVVMSGFGEPAVPDARESQRTARIAAIVMLLVLAIAVAGYLVWTHGRTSTPEALRVRVLTPKPVAVYRWFPGRGTVVDYETRALAFESGGRVAELLPPGSEYGAGDVIGRLKGAAAIETLLSRHRARVAFYRQMRESMRAAHNVPELRQAEIKLADKERLVDDTTETLEQFVIRAAEPGEVTEAIAKVGDVVRAQAAVVRIKERVLHGEFDLDAQDMAAARSLSFCRVEVVGLGPHASNAAPKPTSESGPISDLRPAEAESIPRFVDCSLLGMSGREKLRVVLPGDIGLVPGQPLRLARQRYDAVFRLPASAVKQQGERNVVYVAAATGRAEPREVTVIETTDDTLISAGLRVGEAIVVDPPAALRAGAALRVTGELPSR